MSFPNDREPDGDIWLPHHFWIGLVVMLGGWLYWGTDPVGGWVAMLGFAIVADDLIEHFVGVPTPLDSAFRYVMRNYPGLRERYVRLFVK